MEHHAVIIAVETAQQSSFGVEDRDRGGPSTKANAWGKCKEQPHNQGAAVLWGAGETLGLKTWFQSESYHSSVTRTLWQVT